VFAFAVLAASRFVSGAEGWQAAIEATNTSENTTKRPYLFIGFTPCSIEGVADELRVKNQPASTPTNNVSQPSRNALTGEVHGIIVRVQAKLLGLIRGRNASRDFADLP